MVLDSRATSGPAADFVNGCRECAMTLDRNWWLYFCAIAAPFGIQLAYLFLISDKIYWDMTADISLQYWVTSAMGWDFSEWPFLMHNAGGGFRDHHPGIPQIQLAAIYGAIFGWPRENLFDFAVLGIGLIGLVIIAAAAWGATLARGLRVPVVALFAASSLAAAQPAAALTWIAYQYYIPLLIPAGLAIVALAERRGVERLAVKSVFFMLGYALSIVYFAGIPLLALCAAVGILFFRSGGRELYAALSNEQFSRTYQMLALALWGVFIFGFVSHYFQMPALVFGLLRDGAISKLEFMATVVVFGTTGIAAIWVFLWKAGGSMPMRFFLATAGRGVLGWAIGANILMGFSWQHGLLEAFSHDPKAWDSVSEFLNFVFLTRPWLWVGPLMMLAGLWLVLQALSEKGRSGDASIFAGVFIVCVVGINFFVIPAVPVGLSPSSADTYSQGRFLCSLTIAMPMVVLLLHRAGKALGRVATFVSLGIAALSVADYHANLSPVSKQQRELAAFLKYEVAAYRQKNPDASVVCLRSQMAGHCTLDFTYWYYRLFHESNKRNKALPDRYGDPKNRYVPNPTKNCRDAYTCLRLPRGATFPILVLGQKGRIPKAVLAMGVPVPTRVPAPANAVILEMTKDREP